MYSYREPVYRSYPRGVAPSFDIDALRKQRNGLANQRAFLGREDSLRLSRFMEQLRDAIRADQPGDMTATDMANAIALNHPRYVFHMRPYLILHRADLYRRLEVELKKRKPNNEKVELFLRDLINKFPSEAIGARNMVSSYRYSREREAEFFRQLIADKSPLRRVQRTRSLKRKRAHKS